MRARPLHGTRQVAGNFHIAPGKNMQQYSVHIHDLHGFGRRVFNMSHSIRKASRLFLFSFVSLFFSSLFFSSLSSFFPFIFYLSFLFLFVLSLSLFLIALSLSFLSFCFLSLNSVSRAVFFFPYFSPMSFLSWSLFRSLSRSLVSSLSLLSLSL